MLKLNGCLRDHKLNNLNSSQSDAAEKNSQKMKRGKTQFNSSDGFFEYTVWLVGMQIMLRRILINV